MDDEGEPASTSSTTADPSLRSPEILYPLPSQPPSTAVPTILPLPEAPLVSPAPMTLPELLVLLLQGQISTSDHKITGQ